MVESDRPSDIVDEAFGSLRASRPPEGPDSSALERALQAVQQAQRTAPRPSLIERIRTMNRLVKYPIAAGIALALFAGGAYMLLGRGAGVAFADVRKRIEQAETMTANIAMDVKNPVTPISVKIKMYCKAPGLMRQEVTMTMQPATRPAGDANAADPNAAGPETTTSIMIFDIPNGRGISLVPSLKKATVMKLSNLPTQVAAKAKEQDLLVQLKQAVTGKHEDLGEKTFDGRVLKGYRCTNTDPVHPGTPGMDIWVDPATGTPVRAEQDLPSDMGRMIMTDFVINPKLDDSLFDTSVPEGYTAKTETFDFNVPEKDFVAGLGLIAKANGGVFPKALMVTPEMIERAQEMVTSTEESQQFGKMFSKVMAFRAATMAAGGEFVYAGEGVKLGDKETPIAWFKLTEAKTYRVIYGDLHVEQADKAPTRQAGEPE